jgi:hypothetical protein
MSLCPRLNEKTITVLQFGRAFSQEYYYSLANHQVQREDFGKTGSMSPKDGFRKDQRFSINPVKLTFVYKITNFIVFLCRIMGYIPLKWGLRMLFGNFVGNFAETTWSRFQLNVTAGSQKRAIANLRESEGRDESRFALKIKRNLDFNCKSRSLTIFCHYLDKHCHYLDNQFVWAFSRCVENDSSWGSLSPHFLAINDRGPSRDIT